MIPKIYHGHDKTFFFFSFEQFRQSAFISNTYAIVPTAAQRNGDFSAALSTTCNGPDPAGQIGLPERDIRSHHQSDREWRCGAHALSQQHDSQERDGSHRARSFRT